MIVKILAAIAAMLLIPVIVLFAYMGGLAIIVSNMVALAKCVTFLGIMIMAEILCILELTRE